MMNQQTDPPPPTGLPEPQPNPGIGILRFFIWLTPAGISVACCFLGVWIESIKRDFGILALLVAIVGGLLCAWFDSKLALPCQNGTRHPATHMILFVLTQVFFVVPAILFATIYAICAANPW